MKIKEIDVRKLVIDKYNARQGEWIQDDELIDSIRSLGIIEPLLVRKVGNGIYGVVCGSRRYNAALVAELQELPCVIRDISDYEALGISLQENLQRGNLDSVQIADAVADLWEMMNGNKPRDEKLKEMNKVFGFSERRVYHYLELSRLSGVLKKKLKPLRPDAEKKLDDRTAIKLNRMYESDDEKEEAAEILGGIDSPSKRREITGKMQEYDDLSPSDAYDKVKYIEKIKTYSWKPHYLYVSKAMDRAAKKWEMDYNGIIEKCVTERFKNEGWI